MPTPDPFTRGLDYLRQIQSLAPDTQIVDRFDDRIDRIAIGMWIGSHIHTVNRELSDNLSACQRCFHAHEQRSVQIFAAPLTRSYGVDGVCNLQTNPITILIDTGRVIPQHWLHLVAHEYAHAHVGYPGHHRDFVATLSHLCLGLGLEPPASWLNESSEELRHWPYCEPTIDPLAFWRGNHWSYTKNVTDYYLGSEKLA